MIYDTINPEIINFIFKAAKPQGKRILDVGCGTGRLGKTLKSSVDCYLTGIEIDETSANAAKEFYDEVIVINLEDLINKICTFNPSIKYDFIIFGDILEHVSHPERLLECFDSILAEEGILIASIPNVANWMVRFKLLFGNFDYSGGILDQGHLRFFTYKTAKKLLEDGGYRIISVTNNNATWLIRFLGKLWMKMFAFQFVFKCVKK